MDIIKAAYLAYYDTVMTTGAPPLRWTMGPEAIADLRRAALDDLHGARLFGLPVDVDVRLPAGKIQMQVEHNPGPVDVDYAGQTPEGD